MSDATSGFTVEQPVWDDLSAGDRRRRTRARFPALTILYHPDIQRVGERVVLSALTPGRHLPLSRLEPRFEAPYQSGARPLLDRCISRSPFLITMDEEGGLGLSTEGIRTRLVADGVPVAKTCAFSVAEVDRGVVIELADRIVLLLHTLPVLPLSTIGSLGLIGESEGIQRVRHEIRRVADLEVPVLLRGETGTGKELVANAIHQAGPRRDGPCLSVNMGAIPASLATSELFGATKGSYTSSVRDQPGYFQRAHGGMLFLDEIGEASSEVQVMLLRVIETGEVQRVGGSGTQKVDVRLIAATDADLEGEIEAGRFRAPLLHRLSGYELFIPPLRDRRDDFGRLFCHFLAEELRAIHEEHRLTPPKEGAPHWMPASVVARLARYSWPGNVRQLRNTVRQIVIGSRSSETVEIGPQVERLLREATPPTGPNPVPAVVPRALPRRRAEAQEYRSPSEVTEAELVEALRSNRWEVKLAAERLGISRPSLYLLIDKFPSIRKASDLSREEILEARRSCNGSLDAMVALLEVSKKGLLQRITQLGIE